MNKKDRMKELVAILSEASKAYYAQDVEIMSNYEYDKLYDELVELENETGVILAGSPTQNVGYEAVKELPKIRHPKPMLSLGKTKSRDELVSWVGDQEALLSWKLDGLTVVLTYREGNLAQAVTRGNGEIGELVTNNARVFSNVPLQIPFQGELVLRGEAVISYPDFEKINEEIEDASSKYKNPRNLCSGSVRQLNNEITAQRNVRLIAFALVEAEGVDYSNSREAQFRFLQDQGFEVVEYRKVNASNMLEGIHYFEEKIRTYEIPSDGLVLVLDDIAYGESLGMTSKFPRNAIAFKWADESAETTLKEIEWSPSRTGLINPVAIFEPVELEGTTVSRASVHNISVMKNLKLGIGDKILVYKANMIIPQIAENLTGSDYIPIPDVCPVCQKEARVKKENEIEYLYCMNPDCEAKKIKRFAHFVSRDAMGIDGLSEATLEKLIGKGWIHEFSDLYHLEQYREEIVQMDGFGVKSYENLIAGIDASRKTTLPKFIYGLGIENIGLTTAKLICRHFDQDIERVISADADGLAEIDGVGPVIGSTFAAYFQDEKNWVEAQHLLDELSIEMQEASDQPMKLGGMSFVITGSLNGYANRDELKEIIEGFGGKVTGSVTGKTTALINNDVTSSSSKNKKAKELGIPILSEEQFVLQYLEA